MKKLTVKDEYGFDVKGWSFGTFKKAWNCGGNLILKKGRYISGWQLKSPDGVMRCNEGNWEQFVPFVKLIVSNYGYTTNIS